MPSIRYYNQTAPFWDFVANMEEQGASRPLFGGNTTNNNEDARPSHPWESAWAGGFPFGGPFAHRPRHPHHHRGPHHDDPNNEPTDSEKENEKSPENAPSDPEEGPSAHGRHRGPDGRPDPRGHGPGAWRGRCGGRGGRGGPFGGRHHPYHHHRGGPFGPQTFGGPFGAWAEALFGNNEDGEDKKNNGDETFTPEVDVYDTTEAFVIHASLAGAKKEDVNVSWDAEKSELGISGVLMRDGDEEMLKTLALDERKVGMFERKVRLGSRASPAQVDVDGIAARMEDGVLRVEVPKLDAGYVEIKKVDIE